MKTVYPDGVEYDRIIIYSGEFEIPEEFIFFNGPVDQEELFRRIKDAEAIFLGCTKIERQTLELCSKLRIIIFLGIGAWSYVDLDVATSLGIAVANTPHYGDNIIAEHALALLLAAGRHLVALDREVRDGVWNREREGIELRGKTFGLIGLGGVGAAMARIANGLGMKVLCWTREPSPERASKHGVIFKGLRDVLSSADVVSIHVPLTPETTGLIGREELSVMRKEAILINTARAEIVDTESLARALKEKRLRAAGVDVFETEPPGKNNFLFECENVVLSPHIAFNVREANINILRIAFNNLREFMSGNPVNVLNMKGIER